MALINRVARLFRADFHAVLDQIEEPELMLRQAIRDMAEELQCSGERIAVRARAQEALRSRIREVESSLADADEQLDLCLRAGKGELAKAVVRRKLEAERLLKRLGSKIDENESSLHAERCQADENRQALDGLRQKAERFIAMPTPCAGDIDDSAWFARGLCVSDEEVEIALLHEKEKRSAG